MLIVRFTFGPVLCRHSQNHKPGVQ